MLAIALLAPVPLLTLAVAISSLVFLGALGGLGAWAGGAQAPAAVVWVMLWAALAMGVTAALGRAFDGVI